MNLLTVPILHDGTEDPIFPLVDNLAVHVVTEMAGAAFRIVGPNLNLVAFRRCDLAEPADEDQHEADGHVIDGLFVFARAKLVDFAGVHRTVANSIDLKLARTKEIASDILEINVADTDTTFLKYWQD